ncbi:hypothetical protein DACRYDRAFT_107355 [Dacryopinax primogenitus]|uniref:Autophagy-related protein 11 n=1 Tax=Dacryopinax primogenitus (strain DJM 731) TaxID=1858805 RepID=M5G995_DACPD|nr:uncharacterized protein DACRYDRAFT_107355 [Dacryopinax primogenitus]EJU02437.1 hypothetical protein DACRYDRAFT_107355 [Dacryopinax primogenitus]
MLVHRAETGTTYCYSPSSSSSSSLTTSLAQLTSIPNPHDALLLLPDGEPYRGEQAPEVWVFDLGLMRESGMGGLGLGSLEEPGIRETSPSFTRPSTYLPPAQSHLSTLSLLLPTFSTQHTALTLATRTLHTHTYNLTSALSAFSPLATRALEAQRDLLASHSLSMQINARVPIHPEFRRRFVKPSPRRETLADFVSQERMAVVYGQCEHVFVELAQRWVEVKRRVEELAEGEERANAALVNFVPKEAELAYARATEALRRVQQLVEDHSDEEPETEAAWAERDQVMTELRTLDNQIRADLRLVTSLKNASTRTVLNTLRLVSSLQSSISLLPPVLRSLEHSLRANSLPSSSASGGAGFPHLQKVHRWLYAYGCTILELVRRGEFRRFFHARSKSLAELMHKLTAREHSRRQAFQADVAGLLPFEIRGFGDTDDPVPALEVTVLGAGAGGGMGEGLGEWGLGRGDVESVMSLVRELERLPFPERGEELALYPLSPSTTNADQQPPRVPLHPATEARLLLEKHLARMQGLEETFDRLAERALLLSTYTGSGSGSGGKPQRPRTISEVSGYRETLNELKELKRQHSESTNARESERLLLSDELAALQAELTLSQAQGDDLRLRAERAESELANLRVLAESDRSVRQTLERRNMELRKDLAHTGAQLDQALHEGSAQTGEMEALRQELLHAREEFERVRALQEESAAQAGKLLDAQAEMLRELEEARSRGEDLEMRIERARAEGQKASDSLAEAGLEKDRLVKQLASEAERRLRDQRAEADGDRAVLERHYYELSARVEALDLELKELRGREEVQTADLEEARARLRAAEGEREGARVGAQEWETERVRWRERESTFLEIVALAGAYRDTCAKLFNAVQASAATALPGVSRAGNGTGELGTTAPKQAQAQAHVPVLFPPIDPDDASSALSALRAFPLAAFSDSVLKTGSTIRRWQKNTREYRDRAKGRISYRNFAKGDLALFLPTRNNVAKPWAAFNVGFPHFFLDQRNGVNRALEGRDWLVARIVAIQEKVADSQDPARNPYSLVDGLKYHMLEVELVNLTAPDPSARRKALTPSRAEGNSMTASMLASMSGSTSVQRTHPETEAPTSTSTPVPLPSASTTLPQRSSPLSRNFTQSLVPLLLHEHPAPSPFSPIVSASGETPTLSRPQPQAEPTLPESESEASTTPAHSHEPTPGIPIPFTAPHLPVPASTQHTLITEADLIHPTSPVMPHSRSATPASNRGSFSSIPGRPLLGPGPGMSASPSTSSKAAPTTALMQTSTPGEPGTPSPAESFGAAALEAARKLTPLASPTSTSGHGTFAAIANFGATFTRKRTASTVATSQSQGLGVSTPTERRDVSGAADLLKRFSRT